MKARIIYKDGQLTSNGRERIMQLRRGAPGKGAVIQSVRFWPWSDRSVEVADEIIFEAAKSAGVEVVIPELEE